MQEETLTQKGIRLAKEGKMYDARKVFQSVIDEIPDDASAWFNYGTTYLHEAKYLKALPYYQKAIEVGSGLFRTVPLRRDVPYRTWAT